MASEDHMKRAVWLLTRTGVRKINVAGGEPLVYPDLLAMLCRHCKELLEMEGVSIAIRGTNVDEAWIRDNREWVDTMAVTCDSTEENTKVRIGRGTGRNVEQLVLIHDIKLELNMVVSTFSWQEDMARNGHFDCFVFKPNHVMRSSYLILDEYLCFFDKGDRSEKHSQSILEIWVSKASKTMGSGELGPGRPSRLAAVSTGARVAKSHLVRI